MAQKKIIIESEKKVGEVTLIPVVELITGYHYGSYGIYCFIHKKPVAIILITADKKELLLVDELSMPVDKLLAEMPQLSSILHL
jgi:hypothetical protein